MLCSVYNCNFALIDRQPIVQRKVSTRMCLPFCFSSELYSRELLDQYLSRALGVELENKRLTAIDDSEYVLTLDYTIKMLNIHERSVTCGLQLHTLCGKRLLVSVFPSLPFLTISPSPSSKHVHRYQCGMPVIIEGETGVGKTALVEMLSKLWNHALLLRWKKQRSDLLHSIKKKLEDISKDVSDNYQVCHNLCGAYF